MPKVSVTEAECEEPGKGDRFTSSVNLGTAVKGDRVPIDFAIDLPGTKVRAGDSLDVAATCGCVDVKAHVEDLGGRYRVRVKGTYEPRAPGADEQAVTLHQGDTVVAKAKLTADVYPPVESSPRVVDFGEVKGPTDYVMVADLNAHGDRGIPETAVSSSPDVRVELKRDDARRGRLTVQLKKGLTPGPIDAGIVVGSNVAYVPVRAYVAGPVRSDPARVVASLTSIRDESIGDTFAIEGVEPGWSSLDLRVTAGSDRLRVDTKKVGPSKWQCRLQANPNAASGRVEGVLRVTDKGKLVLRIPFEAIVKG